MCVNVKQLIRKTATQVTKHKIVTKHKNDTQHHCVSRMCLMSKTLFPDFRFLGWLAKVVNIPNLFKETHFLLGLLKLPVSAIS